MNKICTSLEQSKKLIELGIDINTADLTVIDLPIQNGDRFKYIIVVNYLMIHFLLLQMGNLKRFQHGAFLLYWS